MGDWWIQSISIRVVPHVIGPSVSLMLYRVPKKSMVLMVLRCFSIPGSPWSPLVPLLSIVFIVPLVLCGGYPGCVMKVTFVG